jgi:putative transposase
MNWRLSRSDVYDESGRDIRIHSSTYLAEAGIEPSVGSRGDSYDALAKTINDVYKAELIHRRTWKTRESVELAMLGGWAGSIIID